MLNIEIRALESNDKHYLLQFLTKAVNNLQDSKSRRFGRLKPLQQQYNKAIDEEIKLLVEEFEKEHFKVKYNSYVFEDNN